ncbi:2-succinyl-5-enolpyruvyl-6-hydroxy-3-cyclohexene-1-carboxylic-acid synthase [Aestuariimicrobium sp. Y1814]|uniref:2-succinyl-5-enolpyruvyl-6-hydroxy-3- cyclohexene-1-carboxylic-acid synthase n=1 Tax=Aestuariimicrobium sp. Y1814 TaxID=3418742 RepID=UPI003DA78DEE
MSSVELARTVVATLLAQGVRHAVLAPGSRNAPLALALATAEQAGQLSLHVRLDERSAGFIALGLARATGGVVVVVTTSGTAVGNLLPAVMEAHHAGVRLLVLTADRPSSMINSGANQTTRQDRLLSSHALDCVRVAAQSGGVEDWRHQLRRAVLLASGLRSRRPGPVQVNLEFEAPLVGPELLEPVAPAPALETAAGSPAQPVELAPGPRTVVIAGDARREVGNRAVAFAEQAGVPLLAEPSSNARRGPNAIAAYRLLLSELADDIERVVVFGHPTLSRSVSALLARQDTKLIMVADGADWIDPGHAAASVVDAVSTPGPGPADWLERWQQADRKATADLDRALAAAEPGGSDGEPAGALSPRLAARTLWSALASAPGGEGLVMLGSSNPVRDAELAPIMESGPEVHANRGLAGIDGTISTGLGLALGSGRPVTVVVGDLTYLHDVSALGIGDLERRPDLRVVVLDDHGGSIFHGLEQGAEAYAQHFERVFATPQRVDLAAVASGFGARVVQADTADELAAALATAPRGIEVVIVKVDRSGRRR